MADRLEWMNKHLVLLRHLTVQDAMAKEDYKLRPDLEPYVTSNPMPADAFIQALSDDEKYKDACDFLAYALHRRVAIWWTYRCLVSLYKELDENPAIERDIADIGAPKEMPVPEWAKMPDLEAEAAKDKEDLDKVLALLEDKADKLKASQEEAMKYVPQNIKDYVNQAMEVVNGEFKRVHGMTLDEFTKKAADKIAEPLFVIDPDSPIFKAKKELRDEIEKRRKETIELIKSVLPPKVPAAEKKKRDEAMQAVYRWVVAPDEVNTQRAMDLGNAAPDQPAGLLALAAYWSYGDMMPMGKQVVPTPPGLAAKGIGSVLLQAGLKAGGKRKYKERCKLYLEYGLGVAQGRDTWGESLEKMTPPHKEKEPAAAPVPQPAEPPVQNAYKKWTPTRKDD